MCSVVSAYMWVGREEVGATATSLCVRMKPVRSVWVVVGMYVVGIYAGCLAELPCFCCIYS